MLNSKALQKSNLARPLQKEKPLSNLH